MTAILSYEGLIPVLGFTGSNNHFPSGTAGKGMLSDVTTLKGLTVGCWVKFGSLTSNMSLIGKYDAGYNQRSYLLFKNSADYPRFNISKDGTSVGAIISTVAIDSTSTWYFIVGRYEWGSPDGVGSIWLDNVKTTVTLTGVNAVYNTPAPLTLGCHWSSGAGTYWFIGSMAYPFICGGALSDEQVANIWQRTRMLFGK